MHGDNKVPMCTRSVRASNRETSDWASLVQSGELFSLCQWCASPAAVAAGQSSRYCYQTNLRGSVMMEQSSPAEKIRFNS